MIGALGLEINCQFFCTFLIQNDSLCEQLRHIRLLIYEEMGCCLFRTVLRFHDFFMTSFIIFLGIARKWHYTFVFNELVSA